MASNPQVCVKTHAHIKDWLQGFPIPQIFSSPSIVPKYNKRMSLRLKQLMSLHFPSFMMIDLLIECKDDH